MIRTLPIALLALCLLCGCAAPRKVVEPPTWYQLEDELRAEAEASDREFAPPEPEVAATVEAAEVEPPPERVVPERPEGIVDEIRRARDAIVELHEAALHEETGRRAECLLAQRVAVETPLSAAEALLEVVRQAELDGNAERAKMAAAHLETELGEAWYREDLAHACGADWEPARIGVRAVKRAPDTREPWVEVTVFYGTDRVPTDDPVMPGYGAEPRCPLGDDGSLPFPAGDPGCFERGSAVVTIPTDHERGRVEDISVLRLEFRRDPSKHVLLERVVPLEREAWTRRLVRRVRASSERQLMVFVHGYNTTFEQALLRTAQIAHDLPFDGPAIAWSWASSGRLADYWADEERVEASAPHLRLFLEQLARDAEADAIHLVAHSMGSRALADALVELAWDGPEPPFDQVVLAAPDIDAEPFAEQMAPRLRAVAGRVTLYASDHDRALHAAKLVHRAERPGSAAGAPDSGDIHTVDATEVDTALLGHGYIGSSPPVLADLLQLLGGIAPDLRCWLERDGRRWRFVEACREP